jgi:hypothetical protein
MGDLREVDFWPASKPAIKCRIHSAVTQAEAAIEIATPLSVNTSRLISIYVTRLPRITSGLRQSGSHRVLP